MNAKLTCQYSNWDIYDIFYCPPNSNFAVVVLNNFINEKKNCEHIAKLWNKALVRVCVDGGTNIFYSCIHKQLQKNEKSLGCSSDVKESHMEKADVQKNKSLQFKSEIPIPDIISGDFDSIDPAILELYREAGSIIMSTPDQNDTDFTKALLVLGDHIHENDLQVKHILVIAGIDSTRFDHVIAHMRTLYKVNGLFSYPVVIMAGLSLFWLLPSGTHRILIPSSLHGNKEKSWCGYASLSEPVTVTTSGLKWDVEKKVIGFEKMISTSNTYKADSNGEVLIECSSNLLWFMGWDGV